MIIFLTVAHAQEGKSDLEKQVVSGSSVSAILPDSGATPKETNKFAGGAGTPEDPYLVATAEQLNQVRDHLSAHFQLTADIDLGVAPWNEDAGFAPIGNSSDKFTGGFDGQQHVITGLAISRPATDYIGLFGYVNGGNVLNLGLEDIAVTGRDHVGALVGYVENGTITNTHATGKVTGDDYVGGLLGYQRSGSTVTQSYAAVAVSGDSSVGGLAGYLYSDSITASYATGAVSGSTDVGGLIGKMLSAAVNENYATGTVTGNTNVGGFVGYLYSGTIAASYATGNVEGSESVGGFVGLNEDVVSQCYATGVVTNSGDHTGGLVGLNKDTVSYSYATGAVTGSGAYPGGLVGLNEGVVLASFWDVETSGLSSSGGGIGLTTAQMKTASYFANAGWSGDTWVMPEDAYPRLVWEGTGAPPLPEPGPLPLAGSGTEADPYQVGTPEEFALLSGHVSTLGSHFFLSADLDCVAVSLYPIGELGEFNGVFDGGGHVIRNVVIDQPGNRYVGLFGQLGTDGEVRNLGLEDILVTGHYRVGGLVGYSRGAVSTCYATGSVSGDNSVGGLMGYLHSGSVIASQTTGTVNGSGDYVGGLVGHLDGGSITESYTNGTVTGNNDVGGLVGYKFSGTITASYVTNAVSGNERVGGLIGRHEGSNSIKTSFANGPVSGAGNYIGGLVGLNDGTVSQCYATGAVTGAGDYNGGLVGSNEGTVSQSYAAGAMTSEGDYTGGLTGLNTGGVLASFWDVEMSGLSVSGGGIGLTTVQMKTASYFANAGWSGDIWVMPEDAYPRLVWEGTGAPPLPEPGPLPLTGSGTEADPYQVGTPEEFALLSGHVSALTSHFVLNADLDCAAVSLSPIGELGEFNGVFDGGGHVIRNVVINQPTNRYVGLFSRLGEDSEIRNLGLEDIVVTGRSRVGGLVGYLNRGAVIECYVTGVVNGSGGEVGGLVGYFNYGTITRSYTACTVSDSGDEVGGLVGYMNGGTFTGCHATGAVTGYDNVGGLIGFMMWDGMVTESYATGTVTGRGSVGGLVGCKYSGTVSGCHATGAVTGTYNSVGGLVGHNERTITASYATGTVSGTTWVGGLVGDLYNSTVSRCYATGAVSGNNGVGGLVGSNDRSMVSESYATGDVSGGNDVGGLVGFLALSTGKVVNSYAVGNVTGTNRVGGLVGQSMEGTVQYAYATGMVTGTGSYIGGLLGDNSGTVLLSFWNVETSGIPEHASPAGEGRTTMEMTYPYADNTYNDWDFHEIWAEDTGLFNNAGYPYLHENPPFYGAGILSPVRSGTLVAGDSLPFIGVEATDPATGYHWDFGDGRSSTLPVPGEVEFPVAGVSHVTFAWIGEDLSEQLQGSRDYTVVEDTGNLADLSAVAGSVQAPASAGIGESIQIRYSARNIGPGAITGAGWWDRVYLSTEPYLTTNALFLGATFMSVNLGAGSAYSGEITATIPPMEDGTYHLILSIDTQWQVLDRRRLNNTETAQVSVSVETLEEGIPRQVTYAAGTFTHYYRIEAEAFKNPLISILPEDFPGLTLTARRDELPTQYNYDCRTQGTTLVIPAETDGTWYIRVHASYVSQPGTYTISFDTIGMKLLDVAPKRVGLENPVALTLSGAGFAGDMNVTLIDAGDQPYLAESVTVVGYTEMMASYSAGVLPEGIYDVRATDAAMTSDTLMDVVEVMPYTLISDAITLSENTVWNGLVRIEGDVTVPEGITLEILPGTMLEFAAGKSLHVAGLLDAQGTMEQPIRFTSIQDLDPGQMAGPGDWQGLTVRGTGRLVLNNFEICYAVTAINANYQGANVALSNGVIRDNSEHGIYVYIYYVETASENVVFANNGHTAVFIRADSRHVFRNCTLVGNGFYGGNMAAIHHGASTFTLDNCIVAFNANGIHHQGEPPSVTIRHSLFHNPAGSNYINPRPTEEDIFQRDGNILADPQFVDYESGNYELNQGSPAIDTGRALNAPGTDLLGRPRFDDLGMPNVGTGLPPYVDLGAYERQEYTQSGDLAVTTFARPVPEFLGAGEAFTIQWTVANQGTLNCTGPWEDVVYLSQVPHVNPEMEAIATQIFEETLAPGGRYTRSLTLTAPPESGVYYLLVRADNNRVLSEPARNNNDRFAQGQLAVGLQTLTGVGAVSGTVENGQWSYIRLDAVAGETLLLMLDQLTGSCTLDVYVRYAAPPTLTAYDYRITNASSPEQALRLLSPREGTYYIGIHANCATEGSSTYTISSTTTQLAVRQVRPDTVGNSGMATLEILGDGFTPNTRVSLVRSGELSLEGEVYFQDDATLFATFDMAASMAAPGLYDVVVTRPGSDPVTLSGALTVQDDTAQPGAESALKTRLTVPGRTRPGREVPVIVEYTNTGTTNMPSPLLTIESNVDLGWQLPAPAGEETWVEGKSIKFLGISATGPAAILAPGQSETLVVTVRTPYLNTDISFVLYAFGAPGDLGVYEPIDWDQVGLEIQPPDLPVEGWIPLLAQLQARIGDTWNGYLAVLRGNANHLSEIGNRVCDARALFAFEFVRAVTIGAPEYLDTAVDAFCPAPGLPLRFTRYFLPEPIHRARFGPLGRGWMHAYQITIEERTDGVMAVHGPSRGFGRKFTPDGIGGYLAGTGDYGVLTALSQGEFLLTEKNGLQYWFRSDGRWYAMEDTNGNRLTASYDGKGQLSQVTHSNGDHLLFAYAGDRLEKVTDHAGRETYYGYDPSGEQLLSVTSPENEVTNYGYLTGFGPLLDYHLASITTPGGVEIAFAYDDLGRLAERYIADGEAHLQSSFYTYGTGGRMMVADALGNTTTFWLDQRGRIAATQDPLGNRIALDYDSAGNLTHVSGPLGFDAFFDYDDAGNLMATYDAMGYETAFGHSGSFNNLDWVQDARGNAMRYAYDANGNLTRITYEDGSHENFHYDAQGNPSSWTNRRGAAVAYAYNSRGQLTGKNVPDDGGAMHYQYEYDALGNLTSAIGPEGTTTFTYEPQTNRVIQIDYPDAGDRALSLAFEYDAAGRRIRSTDQDGYELNYIYDPAGRLDRMTDTLDNAIVKYEYDPAGRLAIKTLGNGVYTLYGYDAAGQIVSLVNHQPGGAVLSHFDYIYDARGRRTAMDTHYGRWAYEYDGNGQLTRAVLESTDPEIPDQDLTYVYDAVGNRISTFIDGETTQYTSNNMNQYTVVGDRTYVFDLDGNLVQETGPDGTIVYHYNPENRLVAVDQGDEVWEYGYDALGNRITADENGALTRFVVDPAGLGNVVGEYDAAGNALARYTYGYGLNSRSDLVGTITHYTFDALGNVSELTGPAGIALNAYSYKPFGETNQRWAAVANPFQFVGQWGVITATTALNHMRARDYDKKIGRFITMDPIGLAGGDVNVYRYVYNKPVNNVDPLGLSLGGFMDGLNRRRQAIERAARGDLDRAGEDYQNACDQIASNAGSAAASLADQFMQNLIPLPSALEGLGAVARMAEAAAAASMGDDCPPGDEQGEGSSDNEGSETPEDKFGPAGYVIAGSEPGSEGRFVQPGQMMAYRIEFWNKEDAEVPTQDAEIIDDLDPAVFDFSTFAFARIGFLDWDVHLSEGQTTINEWIDARPKMNLAVHVRATINTETGRVYWWFHCVDPDTGAWPEDPNVGFLPPFNPETQYEMGWVEYRVRLKDDLPTAVEIKNQARVRFDFIPYGDPPSVEERWEEGIWAEGWGEAPKPGPWVNTTDTQPPVSCVDALPGVTPSLAFIVSWDGADDTGGSGLRGYDIYVQENDGPWERWLTGVSDTSSLFTGKDSFEYRFYAVATDNVGNREVKTPRVEAETRVDVSVPEEGEVEGEESPYGLDTITDEHGHLQYRLWYENHHFMSVVDVDGALSFRPHPGLDVNGWGSSWYPQAFIAYQGTEGTVLGHSGVDETLVGPEGISVTVSGGISYGPGDTYGEWSQTMLFSYDPELKQVVGSGQSEVTLAGSLEAVSADLNLGRVNSNYLYDVPLRSGGSGDTGDMTHAAVTGAAFAFDWYPKDQPAHFPQDFSDALTIDVFGAYNEVDTVAQGHDFFIAPAFKPSLQVSLTANVPGTNLFFGGMYSLEEGQNFTADNVGITPMVPQSTSHQAMNFEVHFESEALPGDDTVPLPGAVLCTVVEEHTQAPITHATVLCNELVPPSTVRDNLYAFANLVEGTYNVSVDATGYEPILLPITVAAAETSPVSVSLISVVIEGEGEPPVEGEGEPRVEGEGEPPAEGEGEPPAEGEGEPPVEGEGEAPAEGEPTEGELDGEDEACGCCSSSTKILTPKDLFERPLGDWLVIGISFIALTAVSYPAKK